MRFIGSKERLLGFIDGIIQERNIQGEIFADIFSGTTIVAQYFKKKNYTIISNDNLYFSYLLQKTYIQNNSVPAFIKLKLPLERAIQRLNSLQGKKEYFFQNYSPSGKYKRMFLSNNNAKKIDAILSQIEKWKLERKLTELEEIILKTALVEAVPFVSNISGTYGAFLKQWDKRALKNLALQIPQFINNGKVNYVYNKDANELIREIEADIIYLDPPYNSREYISNYHLLETVAKNDKIELKGKSGLRTDDYKYKSKFCRKDYCTEALEDLVQNAKGKHILLSYNSEGIIPEKAIEKIFKAKGKNYLKIEFDYNRFKSNSNGQQHRKISELIFSIELSHPKVYIMNGKEKDFGVILEPEDANQTKLFDDGKKIVKERKYGVDLGGRGIYDTRNKLNNLTGKEWVYRTNSIELLESKEEDLELNKFILEIMATKYSTNGNEGFSHKLRAKHPSPKPPQLMKKMIEFFTKENEWVLDPFMGVGGTLLGASLINRNAVGIDLSSDYINIYKEVCKKEKFKEQITIVGNSKNVGSFKKIKDRKFDLILTDPPYGDMMNRKKTGETMKKGGDTNPTPFTKNADDIGNSPLPIFLDELKSIIEKSFHLLNDKRYILIFTKDFQPTQQYHGMLHFDIASKLSVIKGLYFKGYKIWHDKTINLFPYGYPYSYISNQLHQFILIFQKRESK